MSEQIFKRQFIIFSVLYYLGVNLSIFIMPLYFHENNAVKAYGLAYASISLAGIFALFLGRLIDKFSWVVTVSLTTLIYALCMLGRIITHEYLACLIAFIAGLAASTDVLNIKNWIAESPSAQITNQLVLHRSLIFHATNLTAMVFTLLLTLVFKNKNQLYWTLLIISASFVLSAWMYFLKIKHHYAVKTQLKKIQDKINFTQTIWIFSLSMFFSGCYSGLLKPYILLLFIKKGFSDQYSIFINLIIVLSQVIFTTFVIKRLNFLMVF